jgi:hypothetical protein
MARFYMTLTAAERTPSWSATSVSLPSYFTESQDQVRSKTDRFTLI